MNTSHESTYALLVRSEEKGRTALGTVVYTLLFLSVVLSIWQFAQQLNVPAAGLQCTARETRTVVANPHI
jgi:hypothetical protein